MLQNPRTTQTSSHQRFVTQSQECNSTFDSDVRLVFLLLPTGPGRFSRILAVRKFHMAVCLPVTRFSTPVALEIEAILANKRRRSSGVISIRAPSFFMQQAIPQELPLRLHSVQRSNQRIK